MLILIFSLNFIIFLSGCNGNTSEKQQNTNTLTNVSTEKSTETAEPTIEPTETIMPTETQSIPKESIIETSHKNQAVQIEALETFFTSDRMKLIPIRDSQYKKDSIGIEHIDGLYVETDDVDKVKRDPDKMFYVGNNTPTKEIKYSLMGQYSYLEFNASLTYEDRNIDNGFIISVLADGVALPINKKEDTKLQIATGDKPYIISLDIVDCEILTIKIKPNGIFTDTPSTHRLLLSDFYLYNEKPIEEEHKEPEESTQIVSEEATPTDNITTTSEQIVRQTSTDQIILGTEKIDYKADAYGGGWGYSNWVEGYYWYSLPEYKYFAVYDKLVIKENSIHFEEGSDGIDGFEIHRFSNRNSKDSYGTVTMTLGKKYKTIIGVLTAKNSADRDCRLSVYLDGTKYKDYTGDNSEETITIDTADVETIEFVFTGGNSWRDQTWITFSDIELTPIK